MRPTIPLVVLALALATHDLRADVSTGSVSGRVVVVENGHAVKRDEVWVYLQDAHARRGHRPATKPDPREIRQQNEQFTPHVIVVPAGTVVAFPNLDKIEHNVFSPSDPPGQFDLGRYTTDPKGKTWEFDDPAEVEIYCDIHKEMWARVKVVATDARWIVPVSADGNFTIAGVPPGKYKVHAWTYDSDEVIDDVTVDAGPVQVAEMHLQLGKLRSQSHLRKDGTPYNSGQYRP